MQEMKKGDHKCIIHMDVFHFPLHVFPSNELFPSEGKIIAILNDIAASWLVAIEARVFFLNIRLPLTMNYFASMRYLEILTTQQLWLIRPK